MVEEPPQFSLEETPPERPAEPSQRRGVIHLVTQLGPPCPVVEEQVAVIPGSERPADLAVGEPPRGLVLGVLRDPAERPGTEPGPQDGATPRPDGIAPLDQLDFLPGRRQTLQGAG